MDQQKTANQKFLELLSQIRYQEPNFSAAQRLVANYVLDNYHMIPFLSIGALAENIGVSSNSIIKFCNQLGFEKFAEFKRIISDHAHTELTSAEKAEEPAQKNKYFAQGLEENIAAIQATLRDRNNQENLSKAVEMITKASHIYISGGFRSFGMAHFFAGSLRCMGLRTQEIRSGTTDYWLQLRTATPEDLVIAFSLPPHNPETVEHLRRVHKKGVPVMVITDDGLSPVIPHSDLAFCCSMPQSYYLPSCSGMLALIDVICHAVSHRNDAEKYKAVAEETQDA